MYVEFISTIDREREREREKERKRKKTVVGERKSLSLLAGFPIAR